jgi:hypothetical protein
MKLYYKILCALLIIILMKIIYDTLKETKTYNNDILVEFPTKNEIEKELQVSQYFNRFNKIDLDVRNLNNVNILETYLDNINDFNIKEKYIINNNVRSILDNISEENKKKFLFNNKWRFVMFENLENNFPHTHSNMIFLPKFMLKNKLDTETLIHEKVHIYQRFYPNVFHQLYTKYWHFQKRNIKNIYLIDNISRSNPDGIDNNWVFTYKNINIILISLFNDNPRSLGDVTNYGVYLDKDFNIKTPLNIKKLNDIKVFKHFFGTMYTHNYHPNELSADIISKHVLNENNNSPAYNNFLKWWSKIN